MNAAKRLRRVIEKRRVRRVVDVPDGAQLRRRDGGTPDDWVPRTHPNRRREIKRRKRARAEARSKGGLP